MVLLSVFKHEILKFAKKKKCREEKGKNNAVFC